MSTDQTCIKYCDNSNLSLGTDSNEAQVIDGIFPTKKEALEVCVCMVKIPSEPCTDDTIGNTINDAAVLSL